jgi:hypothetical protein
VRQRLPGGAADRVRAELGVGDRGEVDHLPPAAVLDPALFLNAAAGEVIGMPTRLDRHHRAAVGLEAGQGRRRVPVVQGAAGGLRFGVGAVRVRVVDDQQVHVETGQALADGH